MKKKYAIARAMAAAMIASTMLAGLAAAQPSSGGHGAGADDAAAAATSRTMDAPYIAVPVVRDGQLVNYLFVSVRIDIAPGVDLWRTRERAHFVRDAFVRAAHANALDQADDVNALNEARAIDVFRTAAAEVLGARAVRGVSIISSYSSRAAST
jgi:hypothetical protein